MARRIPLSRGLTAVVDDDRFDELAAFKWFAKPFGSARGGFYAARTVGRSTIYMHRQVTGATKLDIVDHRDGDGLNNTADNLRFTTKRGNACNQPGRSSSGYRGVTKRRDKWMAYLYPQPGRCEVIGTFETAIEAARAYDRAALIRHGEMARTNLPMELS